MVKSWVTVRVTKPVSVKVKATYMETKKKILIVDDEPDIVEFISYNLKSKGYLIAAARDGV